MPQTAVPEALNLTVEAISVPQASGRKHYAFTLSAKQIHDLKARNLLLVDKWSASNPEGYQRSPAQNRAKKFAKFVQRDDGWCPTAVLLFSRHPEQVVPKPLDNKHHGHFELTISLDPKKPLYIPDGQHRLEGMAIAYESNPDDMQEYHLPVMLMVAHRGKDARFEEATQFYVINTNQKKVATDLAQRFLVLRKEEAEGAIQPDDVIPRDRTAEEMKPYAVWIIDYLNEEKNGPWEDLIDLPNTEGTSTRPISQKMFVLAINPILKHATKWGWTIGNTAKTISAFWSAMDDEDILRDALEHWSSDGHEVDDDHQAYVLRTTAGVFSMHLLLEMLIGWHTIAQNPTDSGIYRRLFDRAGDEFRSEWWESGSDEGASSFGTGGKSFKEIFETLWEEISPSLQNLS